MRRVGFTLFELVVVLTITGVLLALAVPRFAVASDQAAVRAALGDLGAAFSVARQTAILRRAPVTIALDTTDGTVEVRANGRPVLRRAITGVFGVGLSSNRDTAVFDPRGLGHGLSNLTVTVTRGQIVDTLTMSRLGRVKW